jgi:hypothetical protein
MSRFSLLQIDVEVEEPGTQRGHLRFIISAHTAFGRDIIVANIKSRGVLYSFSDFIEKSPVPRNHNQAQRAPRNHNKAQRAPGNHNKAQCLFNSSPNFRTAKHDGNTSTNSSRITKQQT